MGSLKWDGSELIDFNKSMITVKFSSQINNINYCQLEYNNKTAYCGYWKMHDPTFAIFDEITSLFNIRKIGTHFAIIGKFYFIFYRINYDAQKNKIKEDAILSKLSKDKRKNLINTTKECIQKIYVLHDMLGINTNDGCISIRKYNNIDLVFCHKILSMNDVVFEDNESTIPDSKMKLWFDNEEDFDLVVDKICPVNNFSVESYISSIRNKIELIVKRIDKKYIYIVSLIINRIKDRLDICIKK